MRTIDVERLIEEDHPARAIWELVGRLDLSRYYAEIGSVEGRAGRGEMVSGTIFYRKAGLVRAAGPGFQSWRARFGKLRRACARPHASNQKRSRISFAQTCFNCPASL